MPSRVTPRQAAIWFAGQGYPVLPLHSVTDTGACTCGKPDCPSKHPYAPFVPNGLKNATADVAIVRSWFDEAYWLNYGVITDGLLVIDVDQKHGGLERWAEICGEPTRALPHTWQVRTGSGGLHVMLKNTPGIRSGKLDKGIDIRGKGGYIVGPTCKHISGGTYTWLPQCSPADVELAGPPAWLLHLIKTQSYCGGAKSVEDWRAIASTRVADGERHDILNRLIGYLIGHGVDVEATRDIMLGWNRGMCDPPVSDKEVIGAVVRIGERELRKHQWLKVVK